MKRRSFMVSLVAVLLLAVSPTRLSAAVVKVQLIPETPYAASGFAAVVDSRNAYRFASGIPYVHTEANGKAAVQVMTEGLEQLGYIPSGFDLVISTGYDPSPSLHRIRGLKAKVISTGYGPSPSFHRTWNPKAMVASDDVFYMWQGHERGVMVNYFDCHAFACGPNELGHVHWMGYPVTAFMDGAKAVFREVGLRDDTISEFMVGSKVVLRDVGFQDYMIFSHGWNCSREDVHDGHGPNFHDTSVSWFSQHSERESHCSTSPIHIANADDADSDEFFDIDTILKMYGKEGSDFRRLSREEYLEYIRESIKKINGSDLR